MTVSRETQERLDQYAALIEVWNRRINLVGTRDALELRRRHIEDCVQLVGLLPKGEPKIADLGSGAGLPGLVIAICRPEARVVCIESDQRKAAFLRHATQSLGLNAEVRAARIECTEPVSAAVVTARALAPLPRLLAYVSRHLADEGAALLMKGKRWQEELENARATWHFSFEAASSRTDPQAVIIRIGGLKRA